MTNSADCRAEQVLPDQAGKHQPDKEADQRCGGVAEEVRGDEDFAQAFFREGAEYQGGQGDADDEAPQRGQPFEREDTGARSGVTEGDNDKNRDERSNDVKHDDGWLVDVARILRSFKTAGAVETVSARDKTWICGKRYCFARRCQRLPVLCIQASMSPARRRR